MAGYCFIVIPTGLVHPEVSSLAGRKSGGTPNDFNSIRALVGLPISLQFLPNPPGGRTPLRGLHVGSGAEPMVADFA